MKRLLAVVLLYCLGGATTWASAAGFDFAALRQLVEGNKLDAIEQVLPLLPLSYRSRYTLLFDSRSLHGSSFERPRVLLYGDDASFIVSFNGEPSQAAFRGLETMEFDRERKVFNYREILFPAAPGQPVMISEANPPKCLKCHTSPARPIWDSFPSWPGAYGEKYRAQLTTAEAAGLAALLRDWKTHPRYRHLVGLDNYARPETFSPSVRTRYENAEQESPNTELTVLLARQHFTAILAELRSNPAFARWQYALAAALDGGCGEVTHFIPAPLLGGFKESWSAFQARTDDANRRQGTFKTLRLQSRNGAYGGATASGGQAEDLAAFRYVVEQGLGMSTRQWTMALEKDTYDFAMPGEARQELQRQLWAFLKEQEPALAELRSLREVSGGGKYCARLERLSLQALAHANAAATLAAPATAPPRDARAVPVALNLCIGCHTQGVGPALPFDKPEALAVALRGGQYLRGRLLDEIHFRLGPGAGARRMPRGLNIPEEELLALEAYFRALVDKP